MSNFLCGLGQIALIVIVIGIALLGVVMKGVDYDDK